MSSKTMPQARSVARHSVHGLWLTLKDPYVWLVTLTVALAIWNGYAVMHPGPTPLTTTTVTIAAEQCKR